MEFVVGHDLQGYSQKKFTFKLPEIVSIKKPSAVKVSILKESVYAFVAGFVNESRVNVTFEGASVYLSKTLVMLIVLVVKLELQLIAESVPVRPVHLTAEVKPN